MIRNPAEQSMQQRGGARRRLPIFVVPMLALAAVVYTVVATQSTGNRGRAVPRGHDEPVRDTRSPTSARRLPIAPRALAAKIAGLSDLAPGNERLAEIDAIRRQLQGARRPLGDDVRDVLLDALATAPDDLLPAIARLLGSLRGDAKTARLLLLNLERQMLSAYAIKAHLDALGSIGVDTVVPGLLALLRVDRADGKLIVEAITRIDAPAAHEQFAGLLPTALPIRTRRAMEAALIGSANPELARRLIGQLPETPRPEARRSALRVLAAAGSVDDAPHVLSWLDQEHDPDVRVEAIRTMGKLGGSQSAERLWELSAASRPERRAAIFALQDLRDVAAFQTILPHWETTEPDARRALFAAASAEPATARLLANHAARQLSSAAIGERMLALRVLVAAGNPNAVTALRRHAEKTGSTPELRRVLKALRTIRSVEAARAGRPLVERLPEAERDLYFAAFDEALDGDA